MCNLSKTTFKILLQFIIRKIFKIGIKLGCYFLQPREMRAVVVNNGRKVVELSHAIGTFLNVILRDFFKKKKIFFLVKLNFFNIDCSLIKRPVIYVTISN